MALSTYVENVGLKALKVSNMAEVIATFKVMPKGVETNLDKLEAKIKEAVKADQIKRNPIAFGLVALNVVKIIPDAAGEVGKIEEQLKKIEGVSEVEVTDLTRAL